ncbi:MAG: hypothetical protein JWN01_187 [Patescibacteria group bacterium]|jgi:hypothetical protein|nr:hypothetical protein [Patescibacteria group bacterium]
MNETAAKNSVVLHPEGYIEVILVGDQNYQTIEESGNQCKELIGRLKYEQKPLLGLINLSREKNFSTGANKSALEIMDDIIYDRVAMFGGNQVLDEVAKLIIKALGKDDQTMVFETREEAVAWLLMKDPMRG